jgi:hypothetical protein
MTILDNCTITPGADNLPMFAELPIDELPDMFTLVGVLQCQWPSLMMISFVKDDAPHSLWMKTSDAWVHYGAVAVIPHSAKFEAFISGQR